MENIYYHHKLTNTVANPKQITLGVSYYENNYRTVYDKDADEIYLYNDCVIAKAPNANSIASKLGLQTGDVIKSISIKHNGIITTIDYTQSYLVPESLLNIRAGDTITLTISRNQQEIILGSLDTFIIKASDLVECDNTSYIKKSTDD